MNACKCQPPIKDLKWGSGLPYNHYSFGVVSFSENETRVAVGKSERMKLLRGKSRFNFLVVKSEQRKTIMYKCEIGQRFVFAFNQIETSFDSSKMKLRFEKGLSNLGKTRIIQVRIFDSIPYWRKNVPSAGSQQIKYLYSPCQLMPNSVNLETKRQRKFYAPTLNCCFPCYPNAEK